MRPVAQRRETYYAEEAREDDELAVGVFLREQLQLQAVTARTARVGTCAVCLDALRECSVQRSATGRDCLEGREGESDSTEGEQARAMRAMAQLHHHGGRGRDEGKTH